MRQQWIQDLLDKIDIEDLFRGDGHIPSRSGKVNCPFHLDRNPSCQIYDDGFYCFGCNKGGSAIDYVMLRDGVQFWDAFKTLAAQYNHPLPNVSKQQAKVVAQAKAEADEVFLCLREIVEEYHVNLTPKERQYLHSRGLTDKTIDYERIGYAGKKTQAKPTSFGGTLINAVKKHPASTLQKTGAFFVGKNGTLTERYQRRFTIPYWWTGQTVYGIGRLDTDAPHQIAQLPEWNQPKYLKHLTFSSKHPYVAECVQNVIWNGDIAKKYQTGVIAEGIIDGLLFKQEMTPRYDIGVISPVATQFSKKDVDRLASLCKHWKIVYLIPDAEESGEGMKGAISTGERLYENGITSIQVVEIPRPPNVQKIDLADMLNQSDRDKACAELKELMDNSKDYLMLLIERARNLPDREKDDAIKQIMRCLVQVDETSYMYQQYTNALAANPALVLKNRLPKLLRQAQRETSDEEDIEESGIADAFLKQKFTVDDKRSIVYYRQDWYWWTGKYYKKLSAQNMKATVTHFIKHETNADVTAWTISNVLAELEGECTIYDDVEVPAMIKGPLDAEHAGHILVFENGWLDFGAFLADEDVELSAHTPEVFATYKLPYIFDPLAQCPKWLDFLNYVLMGDTDLISILQEFLGYLFTWHTGFHKFLILFGEAGTGKSTITKVFTAALGHENVSHVQLEMFGERFGLYPTIGKLANIVSEVGELDNVAEAQLKAFVGGDAMTFDRKNRDPLEIIPTARLVLATNNKPRFVDKSEGVWRRMILIPFQRVISPDKIILDYDKEIIQEELSGIFMWAFEGLFRLMENKRFTTSKVVEKEVAEYKLEGNPAKAFLLENYEEGTGEVLTSEIYAEYRTWCDENGFSPLNNNNFGKEVKRLFKSADRKRKQEDGNRFWVYTGMVAKT